MSFASYVAGDLRDQCEWCAKMSWPLIRTQEGSICAGCVRVCVEIVMTVTPGELRAARGVGPVHISSGETWIHTYPQRNSGLETPSLPISAA